MVKVKEDISGWVMSEHGVPDSQLIVIEQTEDYIKPNGQRVAQYLCECNCRERTKLNVRMDVLKSGRVKSCGCLHKEKARQQGLKSKKKNKYELLQEYGILWTTNTNELVYFDLENSQDILRYSWYKDSEGYASTHINKIKVRMHNFLGYYYPDHHNRNKLDNRKSNLIICTAQENNRNMPIKNNNTSGVIGVYFNRDSSKWVSQININKNKVKSLGLFTNKKDAIIARLKAEAQYYGEFAPQRHLFAKYDISLGREDEIDVCN